MYFPNVIGVWVVDEATYEVCVDMGDYELFVFVENTYLNWEV